MSLYLLVRLANVTLSACKRGPSIKPNKFSFFTWSFVLVEVVSNWDWNQLELGTLSFHLRVYVLYTPYISDEDEVMCCHIIALMNRLKSGLT